ncbi:hypothetical protein BG000_007450 [Podila horticola]|nr:hypothetical protein BG000_007450 [Podila horticola]
MKILSISLSLAAVACAAAQAEQAAIDPLSPSTAQTVYAWGTETTDGAAELSPDDFAYAISELRFRSDFLSRFDELQKASSADYSANSVDCSTTAATTALDAARTAVNSVLANLGSTGPVLDFFFKVIQQALTSGLKSARLALSFAIHVVQSILNMNKAEPAFGTIIGPITDLVGAVTQVITCLAGSSNISIEATTCNNIADMYRIVVAETAKTSPALNLPESASADLRRLAAGSLSVLDLMGKDAIATTNEALLATRPIFATDLLNQFREELLRAESSDIKMYAQRDLSVVVGVSNALEACLRIAADPVAAIDDLNEEMESVDSYEEDDDEDNEDDDEDKDGDEAPEQQQQEQQQQQRKGNFGGLVSESELRRVLLPLPLNPFPTIDIPVNPDPITNPVPIPNPIPAANPIPIPNPIPITNPIPIPDPIPISDPIAIPIPIQIQIPLPLPGDFDCANYKDDTEEIFKTILLKLDEFLKNLDIIQTAVDKIIGFFTKGFFDVNLVGIQLSFSTLYAILNGISSILAPGFKELFGGIANAVKHLRDTLMQRLLCVINRQKSEQSAQVVVGAERCGDLADLYRGAIAHSLEFRPVVPEDASAEIKRLEAGAAAVLEILRTSSITADNMDLLEMRPIFGALELEMYREELLHLSTSDEIKYYAAVPLPMVIGSSNALEACLRIVEDPIAASEDLEVDEVDQEKFDEIEEENLECPRRN